MSVQIRNPEMVKLLAADFVMRKELGRLRVVAKTGAYTATAQDDVILCNGTFTVTLPTAVGIVGKVYHIKNNGVGTVTVDGDSSETIDGTTTKALSSQYDSISVVSDGSGWAIL